MNYFIKTTNKVNKENIESFLTDNKILFKINNIGLIEFSSNYPFEKRQMILSKCDEIRINIYSGKPKKNHSNMVLSFLK